MYEYMPDSRDRCTRCWRFAKFDHERKGSKKELAWTTEAEEAFETLNRTHLRKLGLFLINQDERFGLRTDASHYAVGAVLAQVREDGFHVPMAFWSRVLEEGQRRT